jgi:hypothetical protein
MSAIGADIPDHGRRLKPASCDAKNQLRDVSLEGAEHIHGPVDEIIEVTRIALSKKINRERLSRADFGPCKKPGEAISNAEREHTDMPDRRGQG